MASSSSGHRDVRRGSINKGHDDPTDKYGKIYEESMNPFVQFHRKVTRAKRSHAMKCTYLIFHIRKKHVDTMHWIQQRNSHSTWRGCSSHIDGHVTSSSFILCYYTCWWWLLCISSVFGNAGTTMKQSTYLHLTKIQLQQLLKLIPSSSYQDLHSLIPLHNTNNNANKAYHYNRVYISPMM